MTTLHGSYPQEYEYLELDDFIVDSDTKFHVGSYELARKIVCKICGSDKFEVGMDDYFTAIRCPNCKYEVCVHSG